LMRILDAAARRDFPDKQKLHDKESIRCCA
jgi:hypothetical protein